MFVPIFPKPILKSSLPSPTLWFEHWLARKLNVCGDFNCESYSNLELLFKIVYGINHRAFVKKIRYVWLAAGSPKKKLRLVFSDTKFLCNSKVSNIFDKATLT